MLPVKALTFDVFGTVVDWRRSVAREAAAILGPKGFALDWNAFALAWRARYQPAMERVRSGGRGFVKLDVLHRENLLEVLAEFDVAGLTEAEIDDLNRAWHRLDPWPDVLAGMAAPARVVPAGGALQRQCRADHEHGGRAGIPWDAILGAEVARAYKPIRISRPRHAGPGAGGGALVAAHNDDAAARPACAQFSAGGRSASLGRRRSGGGIHGPRTGWMPLKTAKSKAATGRARALGADPLVNVRHMCDVSEPGLA